MTASVEREIARLQHDRVFRAEAARRAASFGPRLTAREAARLNVCDDSSYFTALRVDELVAAGKLREAAELWAGLVLANSLPEAGSLTDKGTAGRRCWHGRRVSPCARCRRAWRRRELLLFIAGAERAAGRRLPLAPADFDRGFR